MQTLSYMEVKNKDVHNTNDNEEDTNFHPNLERNYLRHKYRQRKSTERHSN